MMSYNNKIKGLVRKHVELTSSGCTDKQRLKLIECDIILTIIDNRDQLKYLCIDWDRIGDLFLNKQ